MKQSIGFVASPTDGTTGRVGGFQAQWSSGGPARLDEARARIRKVERRIGAIQSGRLTANRQWADYASNNSSLYGLTPLAGAGVKGGEGIGATDELKFNAIERKSDFAYRHAMILHPLGRDHEKLTCFLPGLDQRLTGVRGLLIDAVLA